MTKEKDSKFDPSAIAEEVSREMKIPIVDIDRGKYSDQSWSTHSLSFDLIFGGGWPIGGWVSLFGPSMSGKTTIVKTAIAVCQRLHVPQFVYDHEGSQDPLYAKKIGALFRRKAGFHYIQVETGQDTYRFIHRMLKRFPILSGDQFVKLKKPVSVFIIDSLASMLPDAVAEDDENTQPARVAQMHSQYIPLVKKMLQKTGCTLIATNQLRLNPMQRFGSPEVEPGGNAVQFYPDMRVRVSMHSPPQNKKVADGIAPTGGEATASRPSFKKYTEEMSLHGDGIDHFIWVSMRTLKNKHFAPFQEAEFRINIGKGIDPIWDAWEYLRLTGQAVQGRGQVVDIMLPGWEKNKLSWEKFSRIVAGGEFRAACREQIREGEAFKLYFQCKRQSLDVYEHGNDVLAIEQPTEEERRLRKKDKIRDKKRKKEKP